MTVAYELGAPAFADIEKKYNLDGPAQKRAEDEALKQLGAQLKRQGYSDVRFTEIGGPGAPVPPQMAGGTPSPGGRCVNLDVKWPDPWQKDATAVKGHATSPRDIEAAKTAVNIWAANGSGSYGPRQVDLSMLKPQVRGAVVAALRANRGEAKTEKSVAYAFPAKGWGHAPYIVADAIAQPKGENGMPYRERFSVLDGRTGAIIVSGTKVRDENGNHTLQWDR
jgi:hypothetical protein